MQEGADDWYELAEEDGSDKTCCLLCPDQAEGCLCPTCKCRKCYWYEFDEIEGVGYCEKKQDLASIGTEAAAYVFEIKHATQKAILAVLEHVDNKKKTESVWVPRSILGTGRQNRQTVPRWFVEKNKIVFR